MIALKGLDFQLPILESSSSPLSGYLLGGISGTDFLVKSCGCDQPHAGRGVIHPGVDSPLMGSPRPMKSIR